MADFVDVGSRLWLPSCVKVKQTRYLCSSTTLKENQISLRTMMEELKVARDDVQKSVDEAEANPNEPKKHTDEVNGWLQCVQIIEGEVGDILKKADQQQQQLTRRRCFGGCCPKSCWSNYKVGKSVVMKMAYVDELMKGKGKFQELTYRLPPPPPGPVEEMNLDSSSSTGMETMFDKVWTFITNTEEVRIMGLYGQQQQQGGGDHGKTTTSLLKQINDELLKTTSHGFDVVIFVVASKPMHVESIQKQIGERLGLSFEEEGINKDERQKAKDIFSILRLKSFVLLLDDIWEIVDLQHIGIPRLENNSKVIFTTQSENVCALMEATKKIQSKMLTIAS